LGKWCEAAELVGNWHAKLHNGVWRVWFVSYGETYEPTYETTVRASDGKTGPCETRTVAD